MPYMYDDCPKANRTTKNVQVIYYLYLFFCDSAFIYNIFLNVFIICARFVARILKINSEKYDNKL